MASAPVALGLGGVAALFLISGIQGKSIGSIVQGDFGTSPSPTGPNTAGESGSGGGEGLSPANPGGAPSGQFPARVQSVINWCGSVSGVYPYAWGGGHGSIGQPSLGGLNGPSGKQVIGFDCSGAVCGALHAGGFINSPEVSGGLATTWGVPGKGKYITVYANPVHTFMRIGNAWFGTGHIGKGGGGPAWGNHDDTTAYVARHPRGF